MILLQPKKIKIQQMYAQNLMIEWEKKHFVFVPWKLSKMFFFSCLYKIWNIEA